MFDSLQATFNTTADPNVTLQMLKYTGMEGGDRVRSEFKNHIRIS